MKIPILLMPLVFTLGCSSMSKESGKEKITFPSDLKRIEVVATNNAPFFLKNERPVFSPFQLEDLSRLKTYVEKKGFDSSSPNEAKFVLKALAWVSKQWEHDGINQPPNNFKALDILKAVHKKNEKYRCVEYGLVLSEVLQAYGFVSRTVALRSTDVAYGGWGKGHVAMEVWLNDLNKWIFLDPQFGAYLTEVDDKTPLSYYEIFLTKNRRSWKHLKVEFVTKTPKPFAEASREYKGFLKQYFGHMTVSAGKNKPKVSLFLDSKEPAITFQAHPSENAVFTSESSLVYPEINRVILLLSYREKAKNFNKLIQGLKVETNQQYINAMAKFAAVPKFKVSLSNNMPSFSHYQYKPGKSKNWKTLKTASFDWDALKKSNYLEVRAINKMNRAGPSTFIEVSYQ